MKPLRAKRDEVSLLRVGVPRVGTRWRPTVAVSDLRHGDVGMNPIELFLAELWYSQQCSERREYTRCDVAEMLDRAERLGFSLEAGSPLEQLTVAELDMLTQSAGVA